jgi:hypothetical protein
VVHITQLGRVGHLFGLDLQDGDLVDQFACANLDENRTLCCVCHDCFLIKYPRSLNRLRCVRAFLLIQGSQCPARVPGLYGMAFRHAFAMSAIHRDLTARRTRFAGSLFL